MTTTQNKAVAIGINHVALEVGNLQEALDFYSGLCTFSLRGQEEKMAFIDLGDQFLALSESQGQQTGIKPHFGLVVDDREAVRRKAEKLGCEMLSSPFPDGLDFLDPWGNHIQVVEYSSVQFSKTAEVLGGGWAWLIYIKKNQHVRSCRRSFPQELIIFSPDTDLKLDQEHGDRGRLH